MFEPQKDDDLFAVGPARLVFALFPFGQCALVDEQDSATLDSRHFQIEPCAS